LTPEAKEALDTYFSYRQARGEVFGKNTPIFRTNFTLRGQKPLKTTEPALSTHILHLSRKAGLRNPSEKHKNRYIVQQAHGFRKRFITILKSNPTIPIAFAERMAGHKIYSDDSGTRSTLDESYMRPQLAKLFSFFELAIPDLTLDQTHKLQLENELQQEKMIETEALRKRVRDLESRIDEMDKQKIESLIDVKSEKFKSLEDKISELVKNHEHLSAFIATNPEYYKRFILDEKKRLDEKQKSDNEEN